VTYPRARPVRGRHAVGRRPGTHPRGAAGAARGYAESRYTNDIDDAHAYRLRLPCESLTGELTGIARGGRYFELDELRAYRLSPVHQRAGTDRGRDRLSPAAGAGAQKRTVEHTRALFFDDDLTQPLRLGVLNARALPFEIYTLALTEALLTAILADKLTPTCVACSTMRPVSGYLGGARWPALSPPRRTAGEYWRRSGVAGFAADAARHFFLPERYADPFGT
jgi:hypothetical protein